MLTISKGIETDTVVQEIAHRLKDGKRKNGLTYWTIGNCLVIVSGRTIWLAPVQPFKNQTGDLIPDADEQARAIWRELSWRLQDKGLAKPYSQDIANETHNSLINYNPGERALRTAQRTGKPIDIEQAKKEIENELSILANKPKEQAVEECLARHEVTNVSTASAPTIATQSTDATPTVQAQAETRRAENQIVTKPAVISTRRKVIIGLLLIFSIALVLSALTLPVVWGVLPYQFAQNLFYIGLAILAATTILAAWINILSLVERLSNRSR